MECLSTPVPGRPFVIARVSFGGVPVPEASTWPTPKWKAFLSVTVTVWGTSSLKAGPGQCQGLPFLSGCFRWRTALSQSRG